MIGRAISVAVRASFHNGKDEVAVIVGVQMLWHSWMVADASIVGVSVCVRIRRFELSKKPIAVVVCVHIAIDPVIILITIEVCIVLSILEDRRDAFAVVMAVVMGVEIIRNPVVVAITSIGWVVIFIRIVGLVSTRDTIAVVV